MIGQQDEADELPLRSATWAARKSWNCSWSSYVDVPTCIAARHDVIDGAFDRDAESPGHRSIRSGRSRSGRSTSPRRDRHWEESR